MWQICFHFPPRMQTGTTSPSLFSSSPAPPPPPPRMTSSLGRKDTSCREGLPALSGIITIISNAKRPRQSCRHVQCVTALWSPHIHNKAAVCKWKGFAFLRRMLQKNTQIFLSKSISHCSSSEKPRNLFTQPQKPYRDPMIHPQKMKTPDFSGAE